MKLNPLGSHVIISRLEQEDKTSSGIIIPDTAQEKPQKGKVIAVGKGKILPTGKQIGLDVKKGDIVLFGKYSGDEFKIDGEEYLIMEEDDILAIL